ncbi:acyl carrier protein phosphodiesterase [Candidatus Ornithobacterium hominis]|uniref:acyl carrier protein phosphodiesterase n=1 Tax=Candidatus Ornithobacterium hominis TaxID=2497989 RepID=UPI000E5B2E04|nr:acyl carrier protein phosphodiesterase [Candidatus Ornithobacterium hominis]SZD73320.1 acyl carrier protein phosphodiesterase [Candidatus Ornithobacterium hominis]
MNLVAHQLLSFNQPKWQVGNHLGEVVKGRNFEDYSPEIVTGILLHRFIDNFTDTDETVKRSTARLHQKYRKYSPIIIDIFYDYLLIKNWEKYSDENFLSFKKNVYQRLLEHKDIYPSRLLKTTQAMVKYDWFEKYGTLEGLEITLQHLSKRTKFTNNMHMAVKDLYVQEEAFNQEFNEFFPKILKASKNFLALE